MHVQASPPFSLSTGPDSPATPASRFCILPTPPVERAVTWALSPPQAPFADSPAVPLSWGSDGGDHSVDQRWRGHDRSDPPAARRDLRNLPDLPGGGDGHSRHGDSRRAGHRGGRRHGRGPGSAPGGRGGLRRPMETVCATLDATRPRRSTFSGPSTACAGCTNGCAAGPWRRSAKLWCAKPCWCGRRTSPSAGPSAATGPAWFPTGKPRSPTATRAPGHRRLRHGSGCFSRRRRGRQKHQSLCRRDPAVWGGGAAHRLVELMQDGIPVTVICDNMAGKK